MHMGYEINDDIILESINNENQVVIGLYRFDDSSFIEIKHRSYSINQLLNLTYIIEGQHIISKDYEFFLYTQDVESFIKEIYDFLDKFSKELIELKFNDKKSIYYHEYFKLMRFKKLFSYENIFIKKIKDDYFLSYLSGSSDVEKIITNTFLNEKGKIIFAYSFLLDKDNFENLFLESLTNFLHKDNYVNQVYILNEKDDNQINYDGKYPLNKAQLEIKKILLEMIDN